MTVTAKYISSWDSSKDRGPRGFPGAAGGISVPDAEDILSNLLTVDGTGSGLDADKLDGNHGTYYAPVDSPVFTGLIQTTRDDVYSNSLGQLLLKGATDANKRLAVGFDTTNNFGFIQAYINGTGTNNLIFNPQGGNHGFGTLAPDQMITVSGALSFSYDATHSYNGIKRTTTATEYYNDGITANADNPIHKWTGGSGVQHMALHYGGNVLIGASGIPLGKLCIDGGLHIGGLTDPGDNNLLVDGNATAGAFKTTDFTIIQSGSDLLILYGATTILKITSAGYIKAKDEVEPFASMA